MINPTTCPLCNGRVHPKGDEPHQGLPRCGRCGAIELYPETHTWVRKCAKCGHLTDELHGYMVPHLCKTCYDRVVAHQEAARFVCSECGEARIACPH
jgi:predicted RNA-binding Zn-ribbon protein involved in translation (DUF1610 family)